MIRNLLATTALAMFVATGAHAQTTPTPAAPGAEQPAAPVVHAEGSIATNIIGESVYNGTGDNAENIGKVTDIVFDKDGQAKSIVIGVGGFLGVGTKNVAFDYDKLQWAEKNGDRWLVAQTTKDQLTAQPEFDTKPYAPAPAASTAAQAPSTSAPSDTAQAPVDMNAAPAEPVKRADGNLATNIIGESVYNGTGDDAQNIGNVNDIVLTKEGKAQSLVIGVGGFLGIGEKNVTYDFGKAQWAEKNGDRWLVAQTTKEELQALPDFNRKAYDPAPVTTASNAPAASTPAVAPTTNTAPMDKTAQAPSASTPDATAPDQTKTAAIDKSKLTEMPVGEVRGDDLKGTTVYGANDVKVGEIGDVVLTPDNKTDAVIVDVGGFLGVGEKEVAVGMDNLKFMTDKDGNKYLYTTFTKEQLEAQAAYDKGSYAQNREQQRMIVR
ncbi:MULTISPECIES: PRC-barrel domain-containing protein [unclassified Mesorhizobium]|uniref:PRC-barrel domain-containing protein n=1 Tax=unclassified Mesorhizobium TaxID=325217 RepID=UPI00112677B5|nr:MULTISPECIES: PRC-barrel domain-containing protein [unclassified Mesorhizobium]MBZ9892754.1 PRC-barrel domain-containing protein [Mesorhizobium sp. BR1-1-6]MBZ9917478.1 PRC-barrel domain-containing protein [Mesorhizobium sp. BR1-1-7]MBZ9955756.1 PRC-barrel domain-containing protein [Mesorhizobium sp. BR1-1-15]MBZ9968035.1 PRC-barrel domain-containing protein [Mesorhizobium sp. BR1-1-12]MCA0027175.1 PRC-barrel domain-containing protein [Mesorhizobium sp. B263B1A]